MSLLLGVFADRSFDRRISCFLASSMHHVFKYLKTHYPEPAFPSYLVVTSGLRDGAYGKTYPVQGIFAVQSF